MMRLKSKLARWKKMFLITSNEGTNEQTTDRTENDTKTGSCNSFECSFILHADLQNDFAECFWNWSQRWYFARTKVPLHIFIYFWITLPWWRETLNAFAKFWDFTIKRNATAYNCNIHMHATGMWYAGCTDRSFRSRNNDCHAIEQPHLLMMYSGFAHLLRFFGILF